MIFGRSGPASAVHHAPALRPGSARKMPRSPAEAATASITCAAPSWVMYGTVKPKWNRAVSRIGASPPVMSACTR